MLEAFLASISVRDLRMALCNLMPGAKLSAHRKKADLMDEILRLVDVDVAMHGDMCRYVLALTTKVHIDIMIRCFASHHAKTKAESIDAFIRLDAATRRHGRADRRSADHQYDGTAELQLVPYDSVDELADPHQTVVIWERSRLRRRLWRAWEKAARKKANSRAIIAAIDFVLDQSSPCRSLLDFQRDVARIANVRLDRRAALAFFHRRVNMALQKKLRRRRPQRKLQKFVVNADVLPHYEKERLMMWENDTWLWKHATLDGPAIRRHKKKIAKRAAAPDHAQPTTPDPDGLYV